MKITESTAKKLSVRDIDGLDNLTVFIENFGVDRGQITIVCFGEAWSNYWGAMGEDDIEQFFIRASEDYLVKKLSSGIKSVVTSEDEDDLEQHLKKQIIKDRRAEQINKDKARELWEMAERTDYCSRDNLYEILGDEWYFDLPKVPNHKYSHLRKIVQAVKDALKLTGAKSE